MCSNHSDHEVYLTQPRYAMMPLFPSISGPSPPTPPTQPSHSPLPGHTLRLQGRLQGWYIVRQGLVKRVMARLLPASAAVLLASHADESE